MARALRIIGIFAIVFLVVAQFAQPGWHNPRIDPSQTIESQLQVPANVMGILNRACQDCHTDKTEWRWYAYVAPLSWLQVADVEAGRDRMNLSQWGARDSGAAGGSLEGDLPASAVGGHAAVVLQAAASGSLALGFRPDGGLRLGEGGDGQATAIT
jgi:hypothetical protein